ATAVMAGVLYGAIRLLPDHGIWTLILISIGVAAYLAAAVLLGAITKEDLAPVLRRFGRRSAQKKGE
ncbi:MAG: hypothetical protein IKK75_02605, partial [Clostridia bacterium]|nr:hypothetical protein [Clostridia bacterium]